jgi:hypothetical protein
MRKRVLTIVTTALFLLGIASVSPARAQEATTEGQIKPTGSYKVEFTVDELENGKKINSRNYSMRLNANTLPQWTGWQQIRVGSRMPFAVEAGKFEYFEVGMNIDCRIMQLGNGFVVVGARWEYSTVGGERVVSRDTQNPVIRHVRSEVEAPVALDKSTVLSEVDDVASTHRYVFEVKVTKISL